MALMADEIKAIEQAVETLKEWREYVAKTHSDGLGCCISLRHAFETRVDKAVDILLAEKPTVGQDIKKQCDKLLNDAKLVDELNEKNASESRFKEAELLGLARRLISRLRGIAEKGRDELSGETDIKSEEWKVVRILGQYEDKHDSKVGMAPDELEQEAEMTWHQIRLVLNTLGKMQLIEMHKGPDYVKYWLPVEFEESSVWNRFYRKVNANVWKFRLTQQGRELYTESVKQSLPKTRAKAKETEPDTTPAGRRGIRAWLKKHPHSYGLQGGIIFLILSLVVGLFKPQWRQWCWGVAGLAFLVLILSLLGGRSRR